jgi:hypothetical protein
MPLAFVLDEHLRGPVWQAVVRHNLQSDAVLDVVRIGDLPELPLGADDPEVLAWAARQSRLLVTEDRHTMATHLERHLRSGHHSPGILIPRGGIRMGELIECLELIALVGEATDFADAITYIP